MQIPVKYLKEGFVLSKSYPALKLELGDIVTSDVITLIKNNGLQTIHVREVTPYEHIMADCLRLIDKDQALLRVRNLLKSQVSSSGFEEEATSTTIDILGDILNTKSNGESIKCIEVYDETTYCHSLRVCILSLITGIHMRLDEEQIRQLGVAAILHDLGKLCVDKAILNKPTNLSNSDWCVMQMHPVWGAQFANVSEPIKKAICAHHERLNGQGYPYGLAGDAIPLLARIISVADVYDALTSVRPYRDPWAPADVIVYLEDNVDEVFDANIVQHFKEAITMFPEGTLVMLSDNTYAIVSKHNANDLKSPTVITQDGEEVDLSKDDRYILCAAVDYVKDNNI